MSQATYGGCFPNPLTDEKFAEYEKQIHDLKPSPLKDSLRIVFNCCQRWWEIPESTSEKVWLHPSGKGTVIPLNKDEKLDDLIPWDHELESIKILFDGVTDVPVRNMCFHLLWHVIELSLGREPLTKDKL